MNCLYLHIPFCRKKCRYCSFNSEARRDLLHPRYKQALVAEIFSGNSIDGPLQTLFVGGGTPTVFNAEDLDEIVSACKDKYGFAKDAEISIEANPESMDHDLLSALRKTGFNRLSIGIQSLSDGELKTLGRIHDSAMARKAVIEARRAGFDNLSVDLMYGVPGQGAESWRHTLQGVMELHSCHLSAYQLSVEAGTEFERLAAAGSLALPTDESILEMDEVTVELCGKAGLQHYEISNFAQPGYECRHNLNYWHNEDYLGCGAGAVSYADGERRRRVADPLDYCQAVEQGGELIVEKERLSTIASFKETVVMGLRLNAGITEARLKKRYGLNFIEVYGATLEKLSGRGLIFYDGARLVLTGRGRRFANQVMAELV